MRKQKDSNTMNGRPHAALWLVLVASLALTSGATAQTFDSGSDGSDGALNVPANQGTSIFDPFDTARWGRVLDSDGDGVYNFTTISVGSGTALLFRGDKVNRPVYWLATGTVLINGVLDLSGVSPSGCCSTDITLRRQVALPGSGGYAGGAGGIANSPVLPTPGEGPGGGSGGVSCSSLATRCGKGGSFTGNRYLIPMIGGSGGEGALSSFYIKGGGGGGAILIASSSTITLAGSIRADGGFGGWGNTSAGGGGAGGGSGGAIRLVAPVLAGSGSLNVNGGGCSGCGVGEFNGSSGWVRLEAHSISNMTVTPSQAVTRGAPVDVATLRPAGSIRVAAIGGIPLPVNPSGGFTLPDVTLNASSSVNVDIQATGIPPGTVVTLRVFPDTPEDSITVNLPAVQGTLQGTLQQSTVTLPFTFPYGFSRGYVRATWTP